MDKKVFKYGPLYLGEEKSFLMPKNAQISYFGIQDNRFYAWAVVDHYWKDVQRKLLIVGTGHSVPGNAKYVGTVFKGEFVWHLFDLGEV